jgi:hypothetical protein
MAFDLHAFLTKHKKTVVLVGGAAALGGGYLLYKHFESANTTAPEASATGNPDTSTTTGGGGGGTVPQGNPLDNPITTPTTSIYTGQPGSSVIPTGGVPASSLVAPVAHNTHVKAASKPKTSAELKAAATKKAQKAVDEQNVKSLGKAGGSQLNKTLHSNSGVVIPSVHGAVVVPTKDLSTKKESPKKTTTDAVKEANPITRKGSVAADKSPLYKPPKK